MSAEDAITAAMLKAKRQAIIDRFLKWVDQSSTVDIVREQPGMRRKSCSMLDGMEQTGELTIEIKLTGVSGIVPRMKDSMKRYDDDNYYCE